MARTRSRRPATARAALLLLSATLCAPATAAAQLGGLEALASRVSDLSFYYAAGGLAGASPALESSAFGISSFGVELLFEVAEVPTAEARRRRAGLRDSTVAVLRGMEVRRSTAGVDTIYRFDVQPVDRPYGEEELLWTLEVGIGYGQVEGLELVDPALDLRATIRTLPALSLYLSYEPVGTYVGIRTGFMRSSALQVVDPDGTTYRGDAEAFIVGALAGYAISLPPTYLFLEGGYTRRDFPSIEWSADTLPAGVPRGLDFSGWQLSAGIQFPIR